MVPISYSSLSSFWGLSDRFSLPARITRSIKKTAFEMHEISCSLTAGGSRLSWRRQLYTHQKWQLLHPAPSHKNIYASHRSWFTQWVVFLPREPSWDILEMTNPYDAMLCLFFYLLTHSFTVCLSQWDSIPVTELGNDAIETVIHAVSKKSENHELNPRTMH